MDARKKLISNIREGLDTLIVASPTHGMSLVLRQVAGEIEGNVSKFTGITKRAFRETLSDSTDVLMIQDLHKLDDEMEKMIEESGTTVVASSAEKFDTDVFDVIEIEEQKTARYNFQNTVSRYTMVCGECGELIEINSCPVEMHPKLGTCFVCPECGAHFKIEGKPVDPEVLKEDFQAIRSNVLNNLETLRQMVEDYEIDDKEEIDSLLFDLRKHTM